MTVVKSLMTTYANPKLLGQSGANGLVLLPWDWWTLYAYLSIYTTGPQVRVFPLRIARYRITDSITRVLKVVKVFRALKVPRVRRVYRVSAVK